MKILVLGGCGAMGTEATRDLVRAGVFSEVLVADADLARAEALCGELAREGGVRLGALRVDVSDRALLPRLFEGVDVVLNCTSYVFGLGVTEAAIAARRPLLDLGGLYNTPRQLALSEQAERAGITIVLGMGATPGVTNLMARAGASQMDEVHEIHVAFATYRAMAPSPGLLSTVLDEFSPGTVRFYYEDGQLVEQPPFSGEREVEFAPPVGKVRTYIVPHSEVHTLPRFITPKGVRRVDVRGTWRPETMDVLRLCGGLGLLSTEPLMVGDIRVAPKEVLRALLLERGGPDEGPYYFFLNVEVVGAREGHRVRATYNLSHPGRDLWGTSCTARVTGIPASIGAARVARGEVQRKGVIAPEAAFEPYSFFRELCQRDIFVREEILHTRTFEFHKREARP